MFEITILACYNMQQYCIYIYFIVSQVRNRLRSIFEHQQEAALQADYWAVWKEDV